MPKVYTSKDINAVLRRQLEINKAVRVGGVKGHSAICVGVEEDAKITVEGTAGDFFAALNQRAKVKLVGRAGNYAGDTMLGGELIIEGNSGEGAGACMAGGAILLKGDAGPYAGEGMSAGVLIISGDAGEGIGRRMRGGIIIVTGSVGTDAGISMEGGTIYVGNDIDSVGSQATIVEASYDEKKKVGGLLEKYDIKAKLALFEKIVPAVDKEDAVGIIVEGE